MTCVVFRKAFQRPCAISKVCEEADLDLLARLVFRYYERGITEPERLAEIACFMCRFNKPRNSTTKAVARATVMRVT